MMIATAFGGRDVFLLTDAPESLGAVSAEVSLITQVETGLSNRETRRAHSATLRFTVKYRVTADGVAARALAGGLRLWTSEAVAAPLWPAIVAWGDRGGRAIGGGLNVAFKEDWSQWEIYSGVEPVWPADGDWVCPLLWGRLEQRKGAWETPERLVFDVELAEASPAAWAIAPAAAVFAAGPVPSGAWAAGPPVFPFEVNFDARPDEFTLAIIRNRIGFGREPAQTFYPQAVAREQETSHFLSTLEDVGQLLEFYRQFGAGGAFWAPTWTGAAVLTAPALATDLVLQVEDTAAVMAGDWLGFVTPAAAAAGNQVIGAHVAAVGANTITLSASVGTALPLDTLVCGLVLGRFRDAALKLQWVSGDYATAVLPLREAPAEYVPADGETLGTTLGALPTRCYLYEFSYAIAGATYTERWTSFEADVTYGGNNYTAGKLSHGQIQQELYLDRDEVDVDADVGLGGMLVKMATLKMEAPLYLVIRSGEWAAGVAGNVAVIFSGEVVKVTVKGSRLQAVAAPAGTLFDRQAPRFLFQQQCNHGLFGPGCTLAAADWKFTVTMSAAPAGGYPAAYYVAALTGVGAAAIAAMAAGAAWGEFFAGGWAEFGAGAALERRAIVDSAFAPLGGGAGVLTLDRNPAVLPVIGAVVVIYPGCDLGFDTCKAKFANGLNFGGHPFMPVANPTLALNQSTGGAGKK